MQVFTTIVVGYVLQLLLMFFGLKILGHSINVSNYECLIFFIILKQFFNVQSVCSLKHKCVQL